jgi:hypothetical protein
LPITDISEPPMVPVQAMMGATLHRNSVNT